MVTAPNNKGFFRGRVIRLWNMVRIYSYAAPFLYGRQLLSRHKKMNELPKRSRDVAVITGGARGIGAEVVRQLLQADMRVIIGCRNITTGSKMIQQYRKSGIETGSAEIFHLDMQSLHSVNKKFFCRKVAYCNTKLLQVMSSNHLNSKCIEEKLPLRAYSAHPGMVDTGLYKDCICPPFFRVWNKFVAKTPAQGADGVAFVALSPEMEEKGGTLTENCALRRQTHELMTDPVAQAHVWKVSITLTKVDLTTTTNSIVPDPFVLVDVE